MMQMFKTMKEQALNRQLGYRTFAALLLICLWGWMPATAIAQETTDSLEVFDYSNPKIVYKSIVARCGFDGRRLKYKEHGTELTRPDQTDPDRVSRLRTCCEHSG